MVKHPDEYHWSSYSTIVNGKTNPMIQQHPIYSVLGEDEAERQYVYRELFRNNPNNEAIHSIREALNQELVLRREDFKDRIEKMNQRQVRLGKSGRPHIEEIKALYYVI